MPSIVAPYKRDSNTRLHREDVLLLFGVLAVLPLMYIQMQHLSERKHLQFFPNCMVSLCRLLYCRLSLIFVQSTWRIRWGRTAMLLSSCLAALAMVRFSPWLAHVSAIVLVFGWLLSRAGGNSWTEIISWISVLAITLPLPNNLDSLFIQRFSPPQQNRLAHYWT